MVRPATPAQSLLAVFGGQGNTRSYVDELAATCAQDAPLVQSLLGICARHLQALASANQALGLYSEGLDVQAWLDVPGSRPDARYLLHPTVSLPLIGLSQLLAYYMLLKRCALDWKVASRRFVGATGHSQGIVSAVVVAASESEQDFIANMLKGLTMLFHIGLRAAQAFPKTSLNPAIILDIHSNNEGDPSPMLSVSSLPVDQVQYHVDETNKQFGDQSTKYVYVALMNGPRNVVVVGPPQSLYGLLLRLRKLQSTGDNSRVPHSKRGIKFSARFLPVGSPFHTVYLTSAVDLVYRDLMALEVNFNSRDLKIPVISSQDGTDLSKLIQGVNQQQQITSSSVDLTKLLIELVCTRRVDWMQATSALPVTHIVDFGPGGLNGIGTLTHRNKEGTGIQIVLATVSTDDISDTTHGMQGKEILFDLNSNELRLATNWANEFRPQLVRVGQSIHINTKFSRLLGKPPLMVAGMTPTTVNADFVSAILNNGYHVELAGGGHHSEFSLRETIQEIIHKVSPGEGITLNMLFLNVRQWHIQYPLVQTMRREGLPIEGVCIAAGVPSLDLANEIIQNLQSAGIKHVAFKPGSVQSIRQVLQIAFHNQSMPIILQWTGGRAGGHHSFEDMHAPILETYASIRRHNNVILVAGSGFGAADDTIDYLTGDWALKFMYPAMPFDGLLFGSRMLVAKEAKTSTSIKQLIVEAEGLDMDGDWEGAYTTPTGGVLTVRSELGEPIHKIATRGVCLWKELDDTIFSLPKEKRLQVLAQKRDYIINRLNRDYQKVWFGKKSNGCVADLREMTYAEVALRLVELLYLPLYKRWIHSSYANTVGDFLRRLEERFIVPHHPTNNNKNTKDINNHMVSIVPTNLDDPMSAVTIILDHFPDAVTQLLTTEDVYFFITLCQQRGRKPVTFVPMLDENFETWFKKDSLWQSEFVEAVVDQDPQRCCVLQGPVAVRYATRVDEPVGEILQNICDAHVQTIMKRYYAGSIDAIPRLEFFGSAFHTQLTTSADTGIIPINLQRIAVSETMTAYHFRHPLPENDSWLTYLLNGDTSWLCALMGSSSIVQGKRMVNNVFRNVLQPRHQQLVILERNSANETISVKLYLNASGLETANTTTPDMIIEQKNDLIHLKIMHRIDDRMAMLNLDYRYLPEKGYALIHEVMEGRNERIRDFYASLWFDIEEKRTLLALCNSFDHDADAKFTHKYTVGRRDVDQFCRVVQNQAELFVDNGQPLLQAPMDYGIVIGWKSMISSLFVQSIEGDLLKLVHLSNNFRWLNRKTIHEGDIITCTTDLLSVVNTDTGKRIETRTVLSTSEKHTSIMEIRSAFFIRGHFTDFHRTFQKTEENPALVHIATDKDLTVLQSKEYIHWLPAAKGIVKTGIDLIFRMATYAKYQSPSVYANITTTGTASTRLSTGEVVEVAQINFSCDVAHENPVTAFLNRIGHQIEQPVLFENGGYAVDMSIAQEEGAAISYAPIYNEHYAAVSGDYNPIHTSPLVSVLAGLPGTITHGMWTSANTRKWVEIYAASNQPHCVHAYNTTFVDTVLPGDKLTTSLRHVGMQAGRMIISVETVNQRSQTVIKGQAEVEQATACYVFTGQGSQETGMGMELYASSPVAKAIWDRADVHFRDNYGFSILDIVRHNPHERTVHFGGVAGRRIRDNYMAMRFETATLEGEVKSVSLFPNITDATDSYTFKAPSGLLYATQFAQPSLTLVEKAAFSDMQSRRLVQADSAFAGHSLGEYAALAAVGDVLPIEALVDVVFYRGMTMQHAVPRDHLNRSMYGMVAVNPSRISDSFDQTMLQRIVQHVAAICGELLEIVNYNVDGWQYVVAGHLVCLDVLSGTCNALKHLRIDLRALIKALSEQEILDKLNMIIQPLCDKAREQLRNTKFIVLERGYATIPLTAIDVPFHSSFLLPGVSPFRDYLTRKIKPTFIDVDTLVGRYIPNLVAVPFSLSRTYIQTVFEQSQSPVLKQILETWPKDQENEKGGSAEERQRLGHILLIELLAYQFASAVRWTETQDQLLKNFRVQKFIEIGPTPTLVNMLQRTIKLKYTAYDDAMTYRRTALSYVNNRRELYYEFEDAPVQSSPTIAPSVVVDKQIPTTSSARKSIRKTLEDEPTPVSLILRAMIAHKLRKPYTEIMLEHTLKELVGGKSTLQNEIIGDMTKEFGKAVPEKAEQMTFAEVANLIQPVHNGKVGAHTSVMIGRLIANKMPGGFSLSITKAYLQTRFGLPEQRGEATLLIACCVGPVQRLVTEDEAHHFLDTSAEAYAREVRIDISSVEEGENSGGNVIFDASALKVVTNRQNVLWLNQLHALAEALAIDLSSGDKMSQRGQETVALLKSEIDLWMSEHGGVYAEGIRPVFSPKKMRRFDSSWNWVRQEALSLLFDIIYGRLEEVDRKLIAKCLHVMNRADENTLRFMRYRINGCDENRGPTYKLAKFLSNQLLNNCEEAMSHPATYKYVDYPMAPKTEILANGNVLYSEVHRSGVRKIQAYVEEMRSGSTVLRWSPLELAANNLGEHVQPDAQGNATNNQNVPYLYCKRRLLYATQAWCFDRAYTDMLFNALHSVAEDGLSLPNKQILLTGCGKDSIGSEILRGLLSAGAQVVVTTSRFSKDVTEYYRTIYEQHGAKSSCLVVVPFNQGSQVDTAAIVDFVYAGQESGGLGWDLDFVVPFAAMSENGREITDIDGKSELAHRTMLTNLVRILGYIKIKKEAMHSTTRPAQVILPLSPNHGTFGGDGLYGESKIALETLFNRWHSESWSQYLTIVGAAIGWTRGTGLMSGNNIIAEGIERLGVRTFSTAEMAFNILALLHPTIVRTAQTEPLWVDLTGCMDRLPHLNKLVGSLRQETLGKSEIIKAVADEQEYDRKAMLGNTHIPRLPSAVMPRANMRYCFPELKSYEALSSLHYMRGMVDLDKIVVVTGYGEVGPYGNARTRWQMEAFGKLSLEGCIELAWLMGLIKQHRGMLKNGVPYAGWVDAESGVPVKDYDIKTNYEERILQHTGIRLIESVRFGGYDPNKKTMLQEIVLEQDLKPFEASKEDAQKYMLQHGDHVHALPLQSGQYSVQIKRGAVLHVPKALQFNRLVAGQIPAGWDACRYGVPKEIVEQVDPITLYVLVSTVEALISSGITDPYEFYKYVHVTEVGNTSGSGVGGMMATRNIYRDRFLDKQVQQDILQESFINTMPAWVNLLLLSSSGPIKTPVGACATAVESLEIGVETIQNGKAKIVIAGGFDDFQEESSMEFANMNATSNTLEEIAMGREPKEMSRPATSTRAGFMEAQGAGIHVLMSASVAFEMGVPIYGVIAYTSTATDKEGRSVPAPGQGILTTAREVSSTFKSPMLDMAYRRRQLNRQHQNVKQWVETELLTLQQEVKNMKFGNNSAAGVYDNEYTTADIDTYMYERQELIEREAKLQERAAFSTWGNDFYVGDPRIAPLRGALAVWGLTIDDVGVASFHGTGTKANDVNESDVVNKQFAHLGRTRGNAILSVFQKYLTGHPKGAAASWMLNGLLQIMESGIIPGNRNADNIDVKLREFEFILCPSISIQTDGVKAGLLKSFGFGQVGGEVLVLHPDFVLATLTKAQYDAYCMKQRARHAQSYRYLHDALTSTADFVRVKHAAPYTAGQESEVYLNPTLRASWDSSQSTFNFSKPTSSLFDQQHKEEQQQLASTLLLHSQQSEISKKDGNHGVGIDVELVSAINISNHTFIERNFTTQEMNYCLSRPDPTASFAGRWAAKEAVIKAVSSFDLLHDKVWTQGEAAPLKEIEIVTAESGAPRVILHGSAKTAVHSTGVVELKVSISHSGQYATALCSAW